MGDMEFAKNMFDLHKKVQPNEVIVQSDATEKVGLSLLGKTTQTPKKPITLPQNLDQIDEAAGRMEQQLANVTAYVEEVLAGKRPADPEIGRYLLELTNSVPQMDATEIDTLLTSHMNDLLMVTYLSNLIKTQLHLNEKLTTVL